MAVESLKNNIMYAEYVANGVFFRFFLILQCESPLKVNLLIAPRGRHSLKMVTSEFNEFFYRL